MTNRVLIAFLGVALSLAFPSVGGVLPRSGSWASQVISADETVALTGTVTVADAIVVSNNATLKILLGDEARQRYPNGLKIQMRQDSANRNVSHMFKLVSGGRLEIHGHPDCNIVLDGRSDFSGSFVDGYLRTGPATPYVRFIGSGPSQYRGGLINVSGQQQCGGLYLSNVTIQNVYAHNTYGGAICFDAPNQTSTLTNCTIRNCLAAQGSAIMFTLTHSGNVILTDTTIDLNLAKETTGSADSPGKLGGGTIRSNGGAHFKFVMRRCRFESNYSEGHGGAIYYNANNAYSKDSEDEDYLSSVGCSYLHNHANGSGGAIFTQATCKFSADTSTGTRIDNLFEGNNAGTTGGGISVSGYSFLKNQRNYTTTLNSSVKVFGNSANVGGGISVSLPENSAINNDISVTVDIAGAQIQGNLASTIGGGVYFANRCTNGMQKATGDVDFNVNLKLTAGSVVNNTAATDGGGFYCRNVKVEKGGDSAGDNAVVIAENTAGSGNGGGICMVRDARYPNSFSLSGNCTLMDNTCAKCGGGVYVQDGRADMEGGLIDGNTAKDGGGLYITNGTFTASAGAIVNNVATDRGGGICLGVDGHATFDGTVDISHNVATNLGGGVVMNNNSELEIRDGTFSYNQAQMGGGAHLLGGATLSIYGGDFFCNRAVYVEGGNQRHTGVGEETEPWEWTTAWHTERYDICSGVGGAIYLGKGLDGDHLTTLNCSGSESAGVVGAYSNVADRAGNEIVSAGAWTKVILPKRELKDAAGHALGWFEDYYTGDSEYPHFMDPERTPQGMRYADAMRQNIQVQVSTEVAETTDNYLCLTLGYLVDRAVKSLWITDHADAGPGKVHLAFQPIAEDALDMATWIPYAQRNDLVRYATADTEAALTNTVVTPLRNDFTFRDGTGTQDVAKGWCWITVPSAETNKLYKIVICDKEKLDGVQLWENGLIWDTKNVGATSPEGAGYVFWWGDTVGYTNVTSVSWAPVSGGANIKFGDTGSEVARSTWKMNEARLRENKWIDGSGHLTTEHDAATKHLGAPWRLPTKEEAEELLSKCTVAKVTNWNGTGVDGFLVTGKETGYTDKSIFFPCSGRATSSGWDYRYQGYYWTSTPNNVDQNCEKSWEIYFYRDESNKYQSTMSWGSRTFGLRVRGVREYVRKVTE